MLTIYGAACSIFHYVKAPFKFGENPLWSTIITQGSYTWIALNILQITCTKYFLWPRYPFWVSLYRQFIHGQYPLLQRKSQSTVVLRSLMKIQNEIATIMRSMCGYNLVSICHKKFFTIFLHQVKSNKKSQHIM